MQPSCAARNAHARITQLDTSAALKTRDGVVAVLTGKDLIPLVKPVRARLKNAGVQRDQLPALGVDKVRYVGEALAVVYRGKSLSRRRRC